MFSAKQLWIAAFIILVIAVLYLVVYSPSSGPTSSFIMTVLPIAWAASIVIGILRGTDEVKSAATRYGLAFGGGIGIPAAIAFVLVMLASPDVAEFISRIASFSRNDLSLAAVGFGLGVTFTALSAALFFVVGTSVWWMARR